MNTTPADEILALWVEDELHGPELAAVDAWASAHPEWLGHREDARRVKGLLQAALPAAEEPPYPDFFNSRIAREITAQAAPRAAVASVPAPARTSWWRWWMPATAFAGMALCFWAGTHVPKSAPVVVHQAPPPSPVASKYEPYLYTPEKGVKAAYFASNGGDSSIIVLEGVSAIPDSFEIPDTAALEEPPTSTADNQEYR